MKRLMIAVAATLWLAGCTTTDVRKHAETTAIAAQSEILVMQPDVQLAVKTISGLDEPRADWSKSGQDNIAKAAADWLATRGMTTEALDPNTQTEGRIGQVLRLNQAVTQSILVVEYSGFSLPTKKDVFDWTVGPGAKALQEQTGARYALSITARGSFADAGRQVAAVAVLLLGGGMMDTGGQYLMASLIDLETGRVFWFNVVNVGGGADMRTPEGAATLIKDVMKDAPL